MPVLSLADNESDPNARMQQLEKMMQQMQQQRAEQDQQLQALSKELMAVQEQLAQAKEGKMAEKGKSTGSPVYAAFKDGVTFEDASGNWQLAINGRIQADYRAFSPDVSAADTFSLRRARLGGTMTFYKDFVARVEGEYSGGSTSLTYGYIDINKYKQARLRIGQFKPFYGLERSMSTNFTDFQERSMADSLLGSTYDRGVMVHGAPVAGVYYSLAYFNGTGTSDENNAKNDGKDYAVRLAGNLAEMAEWKNSVVHLGGWWASGNQGSRRQANVIPTGQTEGRGLQFFSTTCSGGTTGACPGATATTAATANAFQDNADRTRGGGELALAYGPVKLQGEYIHTGFEGPGYKRAINSWYSSMVWNATGEPFAAMYKEGVFGRLRPTNSFKLGAEGWGALQLGMRYSKFDATDFQASNPAGTGTLSSLTTTLPTLPASLLDGLVNATNEADAWTLGANWILNPNVRFNLNYIRTEFGMPITVRTNGVLSTLDHEDALTMRAQYDF
ncbi:MAG: porin [Nitrosomonadales bacterium]|nr:MAG: porin [Nitrosomonadales bacterium]